MLAQSLALDGGQLALPLEVDLSRRWAVELQDGPAGGGLAAAALAHQTQRLALTNEEVDAIHGLDVAHVALDDDPLRDGEVHLQAFEPRTRVFRCHQSS